MNHLTAPPASVTASSTRDEIERDIALQQPIRPGDRREFYSTSVGDPNDQPRLCHYTGKAVTVLKAVWDASMPDFDPNESEAVFTVQAEDGVRFEVFAGEIDGWYLGTRQYVLPDGTYCNAAA